MVKNMNFNDPDKANGEELSINEDEQHAASGEDDVTMDILNMDERDENEICDEPDETDPEYSSLDKQLDDLNSSQLKALLETSREIRQNIVKEREADSSSDLTTD
ncbi:hypothetical protein GHT06_018721 [Daphnia sinensis]|uniref:Uncharacterized protein n=1 Tax=Daphnia sinensis TaxID=1820382 RepID=A0AAD5KPB2_9CRUS|nr:hypothetical protein GHT06_018721 [Daphnia sinensis]